MVFGCLSEPPVGRRFCGSALVSTGRTYGCPDDGVVLLDPALPGWVLDWRYAASQPDKRGSVEGVIAWSDAVAETPRNSVRGRPVSSRSIMPATSKLWRPDLSATSAQWAPVSELPERAGALVSSYGSEGGTASPPEPPPLWSTPFLRHSVDGARFAGAAYAPETGVVWARESAERPGGTVSRQTDPPTARSGRPPQPRSFWYAASTAQGGPTASRRTGRRRPHRHRSASGSPVAIAV